MKPIVLLHDDDNHNFAEDLCLILTLSGYQAVLSCDIFDSEPQPEDSPDWDKIIANSSVFLVLASPKLLENRYLESMARDANSVRKAIFIVNSFNEYLPPWFSRSYIDLSLDKPDQSRGWNQLIERLKLFVMNQPLIVKPNMINLVRIN